MSLRATVFEKNAFELLNVRSSQSKTVSRSSSVIINFWMKANMAKSLYFDPS